MQLTVPDVSTFLGTLETTIYRWIKDRRLPAYRLENQFRFNRAELLEWATSQKLHVSPGIFPIEDGAIGSFLLRDALRAGGIFHAVEGVDRTSVLRAVVDRMRLPDGVSRDLVVDALRAGSMVIHDGLAIPHVRHPIVVPLEQPLVTLCFLATAVDFGAPDRKPLVALFSVQSPTARAHLRLLSELSLALQDAAFRSVLERRAAPEEILGHLARIES